MDRCEPSISGGSARGLLSDELTSLGNGLDTPKGPKGVDRFEEALVATR